MNADEVRAQLIDLDGRLGGMITSDSAFAVGSFALPVIVALIAEACRILRSKHPIVRAVTEVISPETIERGDAIMATDLQLVVGMLASAMPGPAPIPPGIFDRRQESVLGRNPPA